MVFWVVDALLKVLPAAPAPADAAKVVRLATPADGYESGQIVVRSDQPIAKLTAVCSALAGPGGASVPAALCRFVGCIPIEHNTPGPDSELIAKAPAEIPDVLREETEIALPAGRAQSIWLTVHPPKGTPAGRYRGTVTLDADGVRSEVPVELTVYGFDLPAERHLLVTNWFSDGNIAKAHHVEPYSDAFFEVLGAYARNMAEHRENVFWISPWQIKVWREADGKLAFDYRQFDRYVETFFRNGVDGRIEIQQIGHFGEGGWGGSEIVVPELTATNRADGQPVKLPHEQGLGPFLTALQAHLTERGWLERAMLHLCDEPSLSNSDSYRRGAAFVHQWAPRIRRIEAIEGPDFEGSLEIWVPKLSHLRNWYPDFERAQRNGAEMWFYICCHPTGRWMNRFLDGPLLKVRLLHWLNYRYDLPGYLHWGWNHWSGDPFGPPGPNLPPGDTHTVYPGSRGPLDSLRWETERDSAQDYELLWLSAERQREVAARLGAAAAGWDGKARSRAWCRRLVRDFLDFERDPHRFRAAREGLCREIEACGDEPPLVWETLPPEDEPLVPGPIVVQVRGVAPAGATVKVNGQPAPVDAEGRFRAAPFMSAGSPEVVVTVAHGGRERTERRRFVVE